MRRLAAFALTLLAAGGAHAAPGQDDFAIYGGEFSVFRSNQYATFEGGVEYRWADIAYGIRPTIGAWANGDGALYGYAGFYWDIPLGIEPFMITPGVAIGAYDQGDSKDLGSGIEFRDTIEVSYRFMDGQRLGAQLTHMSNASIGSSNPGVEMVQAVYTHPLW
jgi:lipid A 3-O-deacylase